MSVIKHRDQRVAVFIDTQNLYHSAKHLHADARVNFKNVLRDAVAGRQLIRAMAYVISTSAGDENAFFGALGKIGIEPRVKELQEFSSGAKKADWDVGLTVDAITLAPKIDAAIICSGDGDFVPLVDYLRTHSGVQVEVVGFGRSSSAKLKEAADEFFDLSNDPDTYLISTDTKRGGRGHFDPDEGDEDEGDTEEFGTRRAVSL
jgi:uncharacterized LabA/DUF88 family protein